MLFGREKGGHFGEAMAEALRLVLGDASLRDRLSAAARPSVERFSWRRIHERIAREIRALADGRPGGERHG